LRPPREQAMERLNDEVAALLGPGVDRFRRALRKLG
jgi:hypothetical protein